ncbi:MAG: hypothetical protein KDB79_09785, partial [Acidobacteria bacterium]|nr:hypothetical protein [Acidobacteriota bacterium]
MKKIGFVLLVVLVFSLPSIGQVNPKMSIDDLEWMSGCWENKEKAADTFTIEQWTVPAGMMLGTSRT